ncbi:MAG: patatin-like phospholipase family protein [Thermotogae bacterium]|nr:patatin-like phospholipase family protein [Thermotogota bacterium]
MKRRLGVALGSGGARGLAHLALLEKIEDMGARIDIIAGSSIGAVIGAAYALEPNARKLKRFSIYLMTKFRSSIRKLRSTVEIKVGLTNRVKFFNRLLTREALDASDFLYSTISQIFGKSRFSDCKLKLGVVSTNMNGEIELIEEGYIVDAVVASASIPGAFPPMRLGGMNLMDGGVMRVVPVAEVRKMGADFVVASNITPSLRRHDFHDIFDYVVYLDDLKGEILSLSDVEEADLVVDFTELKVPWYRFDLVTRILEEAERILQNHDEFFRTMEVVA